MSKTESRLIKHSEPGGEELFVRRKYNTLSVCVCVVFLCVHIRVMLVMLVALLILESRPQINKSRCG